MYSTRYATYQQPYHGGYRDQYYSSPTAGAQYYTYQTTSPGKSSSKHKRRATADGAYYATTGNTYYYVPPPEAKPRRSTSHRQPEHVSSKHHHKTSTRHAYVYPTEAYGSSYPTAEAHTYTQQPQTRDFRPNTHNAKHRGGNAHSERFRDATPPPEEDHRPQYTYAYTSRPQPEPQRTKTYAFTETKPSRTRRASYSHQTRPTTRDGGATHQTRQATEYDARKAGIPKGFALKHWDPTEEPILLLGSVFDANSLGKWIYDWTVACHGAGTPMTEVAGDLWLLLIQLAGKIKRAEEKVKRVRDREDREVIEDFLESGERLWGRFSKLLKVCEAYMLKKAKKGDKGGKIVGRDSGMGFVKCAFGRERELERTEKIMAGMRLWSMRFDANCDDILRSV